jgi:hypothetical protein
MGVYAPRREGGKVRIRIVVWIGHWLCLLDSIVGIITFCGVNSSLWFRWVAYSNGKKTQRLLNRAEAVLRGVEK